MQKQYDMVEGGIANDNVIDTVEDYENGIITAEQALGQLIYKKLNHQMSDPKYGMQIMSDDYILEDLINELRDAGLS